MTDLFTTISQLVPSLHGWTTVQKAHALAAAVITLRPEIVLEIGVFGGRSFLPMALAVKESGKGMALGVDPWSNSASIVGQSGANREWWSKCPHEVVYKDFLAKSKQLGLENCMHIHRVMSDYFDPPDKLDMVHIDGNHGPQAEKDAHRFAPNVRVGGLVFMDDLNWDGGHVRAGAKYLLNTGFIELYRLEEGAMFQRVKAS